MSATVLVRAEWAPGAHMDTLWGHARRTCETFGIVEEFLGVPMEWKMLSGRSPLRTLTDVEDALIGGVVLRDVEPTPIVELGNDLVVYSPSAGGQVEVSLRVNVAAKGASNAVAIKFRRGFARELDMVVGLLGKLIEIWTPDVVSCTSIDILEEFWRPMRGVVPREPGWIAWFSDSTEDPYEGGGPFRGGTLHTFAEEISEATVTDAIARIRESAKEVP